MFDSIFIKFGGINENEPMEGQVVIGFSDDGEQRRDIEVAVHLPAELDITHRELRDAALRQAIETLREAIETVDGKSAEELNRIAHENWNAGQKRRMSF